MNIFAWFKKQKPQINIEKKEDIISDITEIKKEISVEVKKRTLTQTEESIRKLSKEATKLKNVNIQEAINKLYEVKALYAQTGIEYPVATHMRLPLYLQQSGEFKKAIEESEVLLQQFDDPIDKKSIYDKMRLMCQRQGEKEQAEHFKELYNSNIKAGENLVKNILRPRWEETLRHSFTEYIMIEKGIAAEASCPYHSSEEGKVYSKAETLWDNLISEFRKDIRCRCSYRELTERQILQKGLKVEE